MRPWWFCNCRNVWCWLDALLECRSRWVCDRHDRVITGDGMPELPDRSAGAKRLAELRARIAGR